MISKVLYIASLMLALVKCEPPIVPPSTQYGTPIGTPISSYGTPNYHAEHDHHNEEYGAPKSYEFGYQVKDDYTGTHYNRQEASDGNRVQGEYRVQLPDGRTQIVTYYADWQSGFHADVRYEGQAHYPDQFGGFGQAGGQPGGQYGLPAYNTNYNNPATSAVSIKDYSGPGTPYNAHHAGGSDGYDSYANAGNFGHKGRPGSIYGAP